MGNPTRECVTGVAIGVLPNFNDLYYGSISKAQKPKLPTHTSTLEGQAPPHTHVRCVSSTRTWRWAHGGGNTTITIRTDVVVRACLCIIKRIASVWPSGRRLLLIQRPLPNPPPAPILRSDSSEFRHRKNRKPAMATMTTTEVMVVMVMVAAVS